MNIPDNAAFGRMIDAMTQFASTTKDDRLSVEVARVAQRLQHAGKAFEKPLTRREISVMRPFLAHIAFAQPLQEAELTELPAEEAAA